MVPHNLDKRIKGLLIQNKFIISLLYKRNSLLLLFLLENEVVALRQFRSHLLVASRVKEEDTGAQNSIQNGENTVHGHVLVVFRKGADNKAGKHQRHDNEIGPLHDLG